MGSREVPIVYTVEEFDEPRRARLVGAATPMFKAVAKASMAGLRSQLE